MKYSVIIAAAGSSARAGHYDKLLFKLNNEPVIKHSVNNFFEDKDCKQIVLVVSESKFDFYKKMFNFYPKLLVVKGGASRFDSVYEGFKHVKHDLVLIHDGARPYVTMDLIDQVKQNLTNYDMVLPVIPVIDSLIQTPAHNFHYVDRNQFHLVQTPQGFQKSILAQAYQLNTTHTSFSDEGSLVMNMLPDVKVNLIDGETGNKKITYESDFEELFCLD